MVLPKVNILYEKKNYYTYLTDFEYDHCEAKEQEKGMIVAEGYVV